MKHYHLPTTDGLTLIKTADFNRLLAELNRLREVERYVLLERDERRRRLQEATTRRLAKPVFDIADKTPTEPIHVLPVARPRQDRLA